MLYIVATPIGNMEDITFRAIKTLKDADIIAAEDTRRTSGLLKAYDIRNRVISYNSRNKIRRAKHLINLLKNSQQIALVSDSGTPTISDPGLYLIRECVKNSIPVVPIPGASAPITAISAAALPTSHFTFYGFLPKKEKQKRELLESLRSQCHTHIFFESPHRIHATLGMLNQIMPEKQMVIARELTKKFEEFIRGTVHEVYEMLQAKEIIGEIVVLIY